MELEFHREGWGQPLPCDAPAPALPFGVGWVGEAVFDGRGRVTTRARAVASEGVRCPDGEPLENEVSLEDAPREEPPRPPTERTVALTTLFDDDSLVLERRFPRPPQPTAPPALAFLRPWSAPRASAADPAPLAALTDVVARSCEVEVGNEQPRCCPFGGSCRGSILTHAAEGSKEIAVLEVRCPEVIVAEENDAVFLVLTRGTADGPHRAIATLRWAYVPPGTRLPAVEGVRLEDALASPGLEARLSFGVELAEPVFDQRARVEADSRSTTRVEVICTAGDDGSCVGLPVEYRGRNLTAGEDGRDAVVAATGWRVQLATRGEHLDFTTVDGTPPESLTGSRALPELSAHHMPRWGLGEPEAFY